MEKTKYYRVEKVRDNYTAPDQDLLDPNTYHSPSYHHKTLNDFRRQRNRIIDETEYHVNVNWNPGKPPTNL